MYGPAWCGENESTSVTDDSPRCRAFSSSNASSSAMTTLTSPRSPTAAASSAASATSRSRFCVTRRLKDGNTKTVMWEAWGGTGHSDLDPAARGGPPLEAARRPWRRNTGMVA